jgi:phage anti-repressor protein
MDIYEKLSSEFSTEEQKIFLNNFRSYLNYDQDKDYVIDFEKIVPLIGFTRKSNAKRIIDKYCTENEDYKITNLLLQTEQQDSKQKRSHGGHNKDVIMMTPNAFKDFCMKANTENAHRIRKYYIKMENILFKHLNEILTETQSQLKTANDKIKLLENKRPHRKYTLGDHVYIVKDFTKENVYKVGSTENLNAREHAYYTHSSSKNNCRIIYTKQCKSKTVLEKAAHHKLREYIHNERHDWFHVDFEKIRTIIEDLQLTLDGESLPFTIDDFMKNEDTENKDDSSEQVNENDTNTENEEENTEELQTSNDPLNFDKFIEECCVIEDKDVKTSWIEINSKYRLWARATKADFKEQLSAYLYNCGFKKGYVYDEASKCNAHAFIGISIIPVDPIQLSENPSEIEKFIHDNFKAIVTGRVSSKSIFAAWMEYKERLNQSYNKLQLKDKRSINAYFQKHFFGALIHDGDRIRFGFYGVALIGGKTEAIGKRINIGNRKKVHQINPETGEIVRIYESLTETSAILGIGIPKLSAAITHNKICNGYIFRKSK